MVAVTGEPEHFNSLFFLLITNWHLRKLINSNERGYLYIISNFSIRSFYFSNTFRDKSILIFKSTEEVCNAPDK